MRTCFVILEHLCADYPPEPSAAPVVVLGPAPPVVTSAPPSLDSSLGPEGPAVVSGSPLLVVPVTITQRPDKHSSGSAHPSPCVHWQPSVPISSGRQGASLTQTFSLQMNASSHDPPSVHSQPGDPVGHPLGTMQVLSIATHSRSGSHAPWLVHGHPGPPVGHGAPEPVPDAESRPSSPPKKQAPSPTNSGKKMAFRKVKLDVRTIPATVGKPAALHKAGFDSFWARARNARVWPNAKGGRRLRDLRASASGREPLSGCETQRSRTAAARFGAASGRRTGLVHAAAGGHTFAGSRGSACQTGWRGIGSTRRILGRVHANARKALQRLPTPTAFGALTPLRSDILGQAGRGTHANIFPADKSLVTRTTRRARAPRFAGGAAFGQHARVERRHALQAWIANSLARARTPGSTRGTGDFARAAVRGHRVRITLRPGGDKAGAETHQQREQHSATSGVGGRGCTRHRRNRSTLHVHRLIRLQNLALTLTAQLAMKNLFGLPHQPS